MAKTYAYRVKGEGIVELKRDLEALGPAGKQALDLIKSGLPGVGTALDKAEKDLAKTRSGLESLGKVGKAAGEQVHQGLQQAASTLGPFGEILSRVGPAGRAAAAGIGAVTAVVVAGIREAEAYNQSYNRMAGVLRATGNAAGLTAQQIAGVADELENTTLASEESALDAAAALATFRSVAGDSFLRTLKLAQDMAAVFGGDLRSSAIQLGKALEDPETGLTALRRSGISFSAEQREVINSLVATGNAAEAQAKILDAIEKQVGGAGAAERGQGLTGAFRGLRVEIGELLKDLGGLGSGLKTPLDAAAAALRDVRQTVKDDPETRIGQIDAGLDFYERNGLSNLPGARQLIARARDARAGYVAQQADQALVATAQAAEAQEGRRAALADHALERDQTRQRVLGEINAELERELALSSQTAEARERGRAADAAEAKLRKDLPAATAEDVKQIRAAAEAAVARRQETEKTLKLQKELAKAAVEEAAQQDKDREAARKRAAEIIAQDGKRNQAVADYIRGLEQAAEAEKLSETEKKVQLALIEAQNKLIDEQGHKLRDLTEEEKARTAQAVRTKEQYEEQRKAAEKLAQDVQRASDRVLDNISDAGADVMFARWKGESGNFWDTFKDYGMRAIFGLASEGLTNLLLRGPVQSIVSAVPGLFGISGGMGAGGRSGINTGATGAAGGPGIFDWLGLGSSGYQLATGNSLLSSIGGWLGLGGAGAAAAGSAAATSGAAGAYALADSVYAGSSLAAGGGGLSFGAALGGAGVGFGVGQLLRGFGASKGVSAIGGAGSGALAGFMLGGPIGAVIGGGAGLLGGLVGGGGKKFQGGHTNIEVDPSTGLLYVGSTGARGVDGNVTIQQSQQAVGQVNQLLQAYGLRATRGGAISQGQAGGPQSVEAFIAELLGNRSLASSDPVMQTILGRSGANSLQGIAADLDFGKLYKQMSELQRPANALRDSFEQLSKTFDDTAARAASFGLSVDALRSGTAANFNQEIERAILGIVDPLQLALEDFAEVEKARLDYARKIGADMVQVERLNQMERLQVLQQGGADLKAWLQGQLLGNTSTLSGGAKLAEAQSQFGAAVSAARAGTGGIGSVTQLGDILLSLGQQLYGGTAQAAALEQMVRSTVAGLGRELGLPGFANGGVSYGPQLAMVSEGRYRAEAHVPLPDGRAIPVRLEGGAGGASSRDIAELALISAQQQQTMDAIRRLLEQQGGDLRKLRDFIDLSLNRQMAQAAQPRAATG